VGITFSCLALIFNALAKGYDFFGAGWYLQ
jgi:hypothetical protein